ncbi:MAG: hypothetical protein QM606_11280, partial [Leucobacter sp.]
MGRPSDWDVVDLAKDPTPGETWGVKALARGYQRIADSAEEAGTILTRVKSTGSSGVWIGEAGDAFREKIDDLPDHLDKCVDSFAKAADALFGWATKMSTLQSSADTNLERARLAADDLEAAQTRLAEAEQAAASIMRTLESQQQTYDRYHSAEPPEWVTVPTAGELSRLRSQSTAASSGVSTEQSSVDDAQARLDAAKKLVWEAKEDYETAAKQVVRKIEAAKDAGIPGDSWWEKIKNSDWWQVVVTIATVVVVIAAVVAIVFTGPVALIAAGVGLVVGAVLMADDVMSLASGEMAPGEFLAMSVIGLLPGGRGARAAVKATNAAVDATRAAERAAGAASKVTRSADTGDVVITLKPKKNWSDSQRAEFAEKVRRMNEHDLVKPDRIEPRTRSFRRDYIAPAAHGTVLRDVV